PGKLREIDTTRYSYINCDLSTATNVVAVLRDSCPTTIIHLAASLRGVSEEIVFKNNVASTEGLLNALRETGMKITRFLLVSSGGAYGNQKSQPISEAAPVRPLDSYSHSKLESEKRVLAFGRESGIPTMIARVFNVFGPGQDELHFAGRMAGRIAAI